MLEDTSAPTGFFTDEGLVTRCVSCHATPACQNYHDNEWGFPVYDDQRLFEKICLEAFRQAIAGFDMEKVSVFDDHDIERLLLDVGIVRHQEKIVSGINTSEPLSYETSLFH